MRHPVPSPSRLNLAGNKAGLLAHPFRKRPRSPSKERRQQGQRARQEGKTPNERGDGFTTKTGEETQEKGSQV